jgi:small metal-binding protein
MKRKLTAVVMTSALTFAGGGVVYAYDPHTDETIEHAAQALAHGQDGHAEQAVKHSEEALKHAQMSREAVITGVTGKWCGGGRSAELWGGELRTGALRPPRAFDDHQVVKRLGLKPWSGHLESTR